MLNHFTTSPREPPDSATGSGHRPGGRRVAGCPSRIRTSPNGFKVRCPTTRRRGSGARISVCFSASRVQTSVAPNDAPRLRQNHELPKECPVSTRVESHVEGDTGARTAVGIGLVDADRDVPQQHGPDATIEGEWSGRRDSNPRPSPWQGDALPLRHFRSGAARAGVVGAESQSRTGDTAIFSRVLYQLSYLGPASPPGRSGPTARRRIARALPGPQSRPVTSSSRPTNAA